MPESYKEDGRPAQQWYWDDWFSAFDARLCSLAARGLWIDMLGIMWKAEIRGTLTVNGRQIDGKTLAKIVNAPVSEIRALIKELEINNVFSRLEDGTIICRRVFRESGKKDEISKIRSKIGKEGAKKRWQKTTKIATSSPSSTPTSSPSSKDIVKLRKQIIDYFNETTGQKRSYSSDGTNKLISGRLAEGKTLGDFKHVIDTKTSQWLNDSKMRKYLRPSTLFREGHFEDYLNEAYEDPRKKILKAGQGRPTDNLPIPYKDWQKIALKLLDKGYSESELAKFNYKATRIFPQIKVEWEKSDQKPETFIKLVESVH